MDVLIEEFDFDESEEDEIENGFEENKLINVNEDLMDID